MVSKAIARYVRITPRKLRVVTDLVRGRQVSEALNILKFTTRAGAKPLEKLLFSALQNARQGKDLDVDSLFVEKITIDEGPTLKRYMPRAMGRATNIRKKSSHITVELEQKRK